MGLILKHVEIMVMNGKPFKRKDEQEVESFKTRILEEVRERDGSECQSHKYS